MATARPGGRSARVRAAVFAATLDELTANGLAGATLEAIATRSGVHKATLYRRWRTREALLTEALGSLVDQQVVVPNTGSISQDLTDFGEAIAATLRGRLGKLTVASYFSAALEVPALARAKQALFARRHRLAAPMVRRAIERGELPARTDPSALIEAVASPLYYRRLVTGLVVDRAVVARAVNAALLAARAGAFSGQAGSAATYTKRHVTPSPETARRAARAPSARAQRPSRRRP